MLRKGWRETTLHYTTATVPSLAESSLHLAWLALELFHLSLLEKAAAAARGVGAKRRKGASSEQEVGIFIPFRDFKSPQRLPWAVLPALVGVEEARSRVCSHPCSAGCWCRTPLWEVGDPPLGPIGKHIKMSSIWLQQITSIYGIMEKCHLLQPCNCRSWDSN